MVLVYLAIIVIAYLIGAIPVGGLVAGSRHIDLRKHGSGKLGTTNVLRVVGRRAAAVVLLGDFLKGSLAVWLGRVIASAFITPGARVGFLDEAVSVLTLASLFAAAAAICGHVASIYMRLLTGDWGGGRGVATAMGAMLVVNPLITIVALAVGIPTVIISRYVSLGSILGTTAGALVILLLVLTGQMNVLSLLFLSLAAFIIIAHRDNIDRLMKGTERKVDERVKV